MTLIRLKMVVLLGNTFLLGRSLLTGAWVLLGMHHEVLTGQSYEHPLRVKVMATILLILCAALTATLLPVWKKAGTRWLMAACCLTALSVLEVVESVMIYTQVAHYGRYEYAYYVYGPLSAVWAILNFLIFRREIQVNRG